MEENIKISAQNVIKVNFLFISSLLFFILTGIGIRDTDLLNGSGIVKIPILNLETSLDYFIIVLPLFVVIFHLYFLIQIRSHFDLLKQWSKSRSEGVIYPSLYNLYLFEKDGFMKRTIFLLVVFSTVILPLGVQLFYIITILKVQNWYLSMTQAIFLLIEVYIVYRFGDKIIFHTDERLSRNNKRYIYVFTIPFPLLAFWGLIQLGYLFNDHYLRFPFRLHLEISTTQTLSKYEGEKYLIRNRSLKYFKIYNSSLQNIIFSNVDLTNSDFRADSLQHIDFINCKGLSDFTRTIIIGSNFINTTFIDAKFDRTIIQNSKFENIKFSGKKTIFRSTSFKNTVFNKIQFNSKFECKSVTINNNRLKIDCNEDDFKFQDS